MNEKEKKEVRSEKEGMTATHPNLSASWLLCGVWGPKKRGLSVILDLDHLPEKS